MAQREQRTRQSVSLSENIANYFREYCNCTSIHGLKYLGQRRTLWEKLWWITFLGLCSVALAISIGAVYQKWSNSPIIVTIATKYEPISRLPFPAITVCSESKLKASAYNFKELLQKNLRGDNLTRNETKILNYMAAVCGDLTKSEFKHLPPADFVPILKTITPNYFLTNCKQSSIRVDCQKYFIPVLTDEGLCYTFNILDRVEMFQAKVVNNSDYHLVNQSSANWSTEFGYSSNAGLYAYPRRALLAGASYAVTFDLITSKTDMVHTCTDSVEGYKVLLHSPIRVPRLTQPYIQIPLDQTVVGTIRPSMINTSLSGKSYSPDKRQCYFPSERNLLYFRTYSKTNCDVECLTNHTLTLCGCLHFAMPRENHTRICGGRDLDCLSMADHQVRLAHLLKNIEKSEFKDTAKDALIKLDCGCLPLCTDIEYDLRTSQTYWNWKGIAGILGNLNTDEHHLSRVTVFFQSGDFLPFERNVLYGPLDFLGHFGGLMGLFMGFSVISFLEVVYFLSLRLMCNVRLLGHYWSQQE